MKFSNFDFIFLIQSIFNVFLTFVYFKKIDFSLKLSVVEKKFLEKAALIFSFGFFVSTLLIMTFYVFPNENFISIRMLICYLNQIISYLSIIQFVRLIKIKNN